MSVALFLDREPQFVKLAAGKKLGANPDGWAHEILAQLHSQHPYLGTWQLTFQEQGRDDEQGYLYGYFFVASREPVAPQMQPEGEVARPELQQQEAASAAPGGPPSARIPVIVNNRSLSPMDVMIDPSGTFLPLNETRLNETMISPDTFVATKAQLPPVEMNNEFTPPARAGNAQIKTASLSAIGAGGAPDLRASLLGTVESDPELLHQLVNNEAFRNVVGAVHHARPWGNHAADEVDCVVLAKHAGAFQMLSARAASYEPARVAIPRSGISAVPDEHHQELLKEGHVVVHETAVAVVPLAFTAIEQTARVKVAALDGTVTHGMVVTDVRRLDGSSADAQLFLDLERPEYWALQPKIAGVAWADEGGDVRFGRPDGFGTFVRLEDGHVLWATEPLTVTSTVLSKTGQASWTVEQGVRRGRIKSASHIVAPVELGATEWALPSDCVFVYLGKREKLASDGRGAETAHGSVTTAQRIKVACASGAFTLSGGCGVNGLPLQQRQSLSSDEAALLLGTAGVADPYGVLKTAQASVRLGAPGVTWAYGCRDLVPAGSVRARSKTAAVTVRSAFPIPRLSLVKEAAVLTDEASVDAVLSLGFISPDNVAAYMDSRDLFEQVVRKLAELLIAVRIGLQDVPEAAVSKAMNGVEDTLRGLESLEIRAADGQPGLQAAQ